MPDPSFFETFAQYPDLESIAESGVWSQTNTGANDLVAGRFAGEKAVQLTGASGSSSRSLTLLMESQAEQADCWAYQISTLPSQEMVMVIWYDGSTGHLALTLDNSGVWRLRRGASTAGTLLQTSEAAAIVPNVWYNAEVARKIDDSSGYFQFFLNGEEVLAVTGADTRNGAAAQVNRIVWGQSTGGTQPTQLVTAVRLYPGAQSLPIGDRRGRWRIADGVVANSGVVAADDGPLASALSAFPQTMERGVLFASPGNSIEVSLSAVGAVLDTIDGVRLVFPYEKNDAGDCTFRVGIKRGSTTFWHPNTLAASTSRQRASLVFPTDPDEDPWTDTAFAETSVVIERLT